MCITHTSKCSILYIDGSKLLKVQEGNADAEGSDGTTCEGYDGVNQGTLLLIRISFRRA